MLGRNDIDADLRAWRDLADLDRSQAGLLVLVTLDDVETLIKQRGKLGVVHFLGRDLLGGEILVIDLENARFVDQTIEQEVGEDGKALVLLPENMINQRRRCDRLFLVIRVAGDKPHNLRAAIEHVEELWQQIINGIAYIGRNNARSPGRGLVKRLAEHGSGSVDPVLLKVRIRIVDRRADLVIQPRLNIVVHLLRLPGPAARAFGLRFGLGRFGGFLFCGTAAKVQIHVIQPYCFVVSYLTRGAVNYKFCAFSSKNASTSSAVMVRNFFLNRAASLSRQSIARAFSSSRLSSVLAPLSPTTARSLSSLTK